MPIPLSWLKEFVDIKMPFKELAEKLSEAGLTVETWKEADGDIIFDPEVTPNRPDWLSIVGVAREVDAVTNSRITYNVSRIKYKTTGKLSEITIKPQFDLCPRYTAAVVKNVKVKPSPEWLQKRIKQIGLRPINNLVDITNFVMWETGNPLHVFDLDKIRGKKMTMDEARGAETFRSLDGIDYKLSKGAIVIKDIGRVIDLCGVKGGENTSITSATNNILIHVPVYDPLKIRQASRSMNIRSDASSLYEKGVNPDNTLQAICRALELVLDTAGGAFSGEVLDLKEHDFKPWTVNLRHSHLEKILGITISQQEVLNIFSRLGLLIKDNLGIYTVTVPFRRSDLKIEEDLVEEVVRIHGFNSFPKTLPNGPIPTDKAAYVWDYDVAFTAKQILAGAGFSEIYSYSLISDKQLKNLGINSESKDIFGIINPISTDFEYLRPTLTGNLIEALKLNLATTSDIKLFELGKIYQGKDLKNLTEPYRLTAIMSGERFTWLKGTLELLFNRLNIETHFFAEDKSDDKTLAWFHPSRVAAIKTQGGKNLGTIGELHPDLLLKFSLKGHAVIFDIDYLVLCQSIKHPKYQPLPKNPPTIEDFSFIVPVNLYIGELITSLKKLSPWISQLTLIDSKESNRTVRIYFNHPEKTLTDAEIKPLREKIIKEASALGATLRRD